MDPLQHVAVVAALVRAQRPLPDPTLLAVRDYYAYVDEHRERLISWRSSDIFQAWVGSMISNVRLWPSTVAERATAVARVNPDPWNRDSTLGRMELASVLSSVKRHRTEVGPRNVKPRYDLEVFEKVVTAPCPASTAYKVHLMYQTITWIAIATGNRSVHCLNAPEITLLDDRVRVRWGPRKYMVALQTPVDYPFSWTFPPPSHVRAFLLVTNGQGMLYWTDDPERRASVSKYLNSWLPKLGTGLTRWEEGKGESGLSSGCPRVHMANVLIPLVESGEISRERYQLLMGHSFLTGMRMYRKAPVEASDATLV